MENIKSKFNIVVLLIYVCLALISAFIFSNLWIAVAWLGIGLIAGVAKCKKI